MLLQCFYGVPELRSAVASYALAPTSGDGPAPGHRCAMCTTTAPAAYKQLGCTGDSEPDGPQ